MKISIKNFGPIREAKNIQISPLTLFVGPSNTGKSYLATVLYAIFKAFNPPPYFDFNLQVQHIDGNITTPSEELQKMVVNGASATKTKTLTNNLIKTMFLGWAETMGEAWREQIQLYFGEASAKLIQKKDLSVTLSLDDDDIFLNFTSPDKSRMNSQIREVISGEIMSALKENLNHRSPFIPCMDGFFRALSITLTKNLAGTHYLPAIRGGIIQNRRTLLDAMTQQAAKPYVSGTSIQLMDTTPRLTGVVSDFIRKLNNVSKDTAPPGNRLQEIDEYISSEIMEGHIEHDKNETGHPFFIYKFSKNGSDHHLSLQNTSSMVAELAPVSIFIRHYLKVKDLFILEEPETNLHPQGQRNISDILVRLANAGVSVLATTHSDIVLEQISNTVHASRLKPGVRNRGDKPLCLEEEKVSVYSFAKRIKGMTVVQPCSFDSTTGFVTDDHLEVSSELYNDAVHLLNNRKDD